DLRLQALRYSAGDPELMLVQANVLQGPEHIAALERVLVLVDPASEMARNLRSHIQSDRALGDRKPRRLTSPYQHSKIKLYAVMDGATRLIGAGMHVQVNQKQTVRLLLDTGATGIALSPKAAEKIGLEPIEAESSKA